MKHRFFLIVAMALVIAMWSASAQALDTAACTDGRWFNPMDQHCIGLLTPEEMGSFDDTGLFTWNGNFETELHGWAQYADHNWRDNWRPAILGLDINYARMDYRHRIGKANDVRVVLQGSTGGVSTPWLWRVHPVNEDGSWGSETFFGYFGDLLPDSTVASLNRYSIPGTALSSTDIAAMTWNGISLTSGFTDYFSDYQYLEYNLGPNVWHQTFSQYTTQPEIYSPSFGPGTMPDLDLNTVDVTLASGISFTLVFNATTLDDMPVVPAMTEVPWVNGAGKPSKKKTVEVQNLTARESDGALIIQWSEPEGALNRPGMRLRMYAGDSWGLSVPKARDTYLFIDCPVQTGTVVVPADIWEGFKQKMQAMGESSVFVAGMYRFQPRYTMDNGWVTQYHNRGYFEYITVPIQ